MRFIQKMEKRFPWLGNAVILFTIICLGTFLRLQYLNKSPFPMNDGGLFYVMIRDLQQNGFHLPQFTTYNFNNIPYAYPPLSLYEAAWLNQFFQIDLLKIFLYYPLAFNLLSIPALYFLAKQLTENLRTALFATAFYAILNPSFEWLISGGGLTRSPAHTYFIVSLALFLVYLRTSKKLAFILSVVAAALMSLHHIEYAWMLVYSVLIFTFFRRRSLNSILVIAIFGFSIGALTSPYWITILKNHGLSPFLSAFSTGEFSAVNSILRLTLLNFSPEPFSKLVDTLAVIGIFVCLSKKDYSLVIWFIMIIFLNYRSAYRALVFPLSIFVGLSLDTLLIPGLNQIMKNIQKNTHLPIKKPLQMGNLLAIFSLLMTFLLGYISSFTNHPILSSINSYEEKAMEWVKANTNPGSEFLIIGPSTNWSNDRVGEWFPAIASRHSETTLQGIEWLPNKEFSKKIILYDELKQCLGEGEPCLDSWTDRTKSSFTHLFISKFECGWNSSNCTNYFILTVEDSNAYDKIYENEGVVIYEHK